MKYVMKFNPNGTSYLVLVSEEKVSLLNTPQVGVPSVSLTQRVNALESAVADLMMLSIKEENQ